MFNDKYGLTDAVLQGRKTMTRRLIKQEVAIVRHFNPRLFPEGYDPSAFYRDERGMCRLIDTDGNYIEPIYEIGEVVAVAQPYSSFRPLISHNDDYSPSHPGWDNKMFVRADLMPHQIRITDIKVERLQDISDEDCLKEGIMVHPGWPAMSDLYVFQGRTPLENYLTPREAFASLIDKVSGRGTWESNPHVFAYTFEKIK